jgi:uncharacterized membrane protein YfcA
MDFSIDWIWLFLIGIASGYLNVMAGGGSTLALPMLIFMGLDSALANGTNRIAILIQNISAVWSFRRLDMHEFKTSFSLSLWTLPGAIAGAFLATKISDEWFQRILAVIMIGVIISMFIPLARKNGPSQSTSPTSKYIYPALFFIGLYGGFIQVGVGFLFMAALYHFMQMDLVRVNMHKVFIVLIYTIPAILIFFWTGNVAWLPGLVLGLGSAVGGWAAAHSSLKGGEKIIRILLIVAIVIMILKLLEVF